MYVGSVQTFLFSYRWLEEFALQETQVHKEFHIDCDISGPRGQNLNHRFTFFLADLKKTLAVLLDNIMLRLGKLEAKVENIYNGTGGNLTNGTSTATPSATNSEKVNVAGMYPPIFFLCFGQGIVPKDLSLS